MGTEFFDELGETITRTAKGIGEKAEQFYEAQKLRNKISGEDRIIDKIMADLGNILYKRYSDGDILSDEERELCEQIDQHKALILHYKDILAGMKGKKICPSCQAAVDRAASFCPNCGASVPTPEPEEEAGDVVDEVVEAEFVVEDAAVEEAPAEEAAAGETAAEEASGEEPTA